MIYTESEKDSLRRFMRVESPLATFARSLRNDGTKAGDVEPDLLKGIDVDNLPDDLKEKLTAANDQFKTTLKEKQTSAAEKAKAEELAKQHQARADRNFELLRKHNLIGADGKPTVGDVEDPKVASLQTLTNKIAKEMNVKPEVAGQYAQMMQIALAEQEKSILEKVGGGLRDTFQTVGSLQGDRLLAAAELADKEGILQIDEVHKTVKDNLDALILSGTQILPETIENLKDMAYGKYVKGLSPEEREKVLTTPIQQQTSSFSTRRGGIVSAPVTRTHQGGGEPVAANPETSAAVAATLAHMKRGMKGAK